jgi:phosphatidylglycerophosphate synthase
MDGCHPWVALLALAVIAFFLARNGIWIASFPIPEGPSGGGFLGARARLWYRECIRPLEEVLAATGIGPTAITYCQLGLAAAAGLAFAAGAMFLAGWLVIAAGTLDVLDGSVARRTKRDTSRGAFVDSVVDRYAEMLAFAGLAFYFRGSWVAGVVWLALFGSLMVSYTRARAEGLGIDCPIGGAQRPERVVVLGAGAFLSAIVAHLWCSWTGVFSHGVLAAALGALAVLTNATAYRRARWIAGRLAGSP